MTELPKYESYTSKELAWVVFADTILTATVGGPRSVDETVQAGLTIFSPKNESTGVAFAENFINDYSFDSRIQGLGLPINFNAQILSTSLFSLFEGFSKLTPEERAVVLTDFNHAISF